MAQDAADQGDAAGLDRRGNDDPAILLDGLRSEHCPSSAARRIARSDVPQEPRHSSIFIRNPVYGTRCSTVVLVDAEGKGIIIERRFSALGEPTGETAMDFRWP